MAMKKVKVPLAVLERAKAAAPQPAARPSQPPQASARGKKPQAREKVIAALKKLHPMD